MRTFFQRFVQFARVARQRGWRSAVKATACHIGKRLDLTTAPQVDAIHTAIAALRAGLAAHDAKFATEESQLIAQDGCLTAHTTELAAQQSMLLAQTSTLADHGLAIEAQRTGLEKQRADGAKQRAELDALRSSVTARDLVFEAQRLAVDAVRSELRGLRAEFEGERSKLVDLTTTVSQLGEENQRLRQQLDGCRQQIEALQCWKHRNAQTIRWLADHHAARLSPGGSDPDGASFSAKPRVSVILPTWNRAATIEGAIQSVLDQTCADWELLVVDDGSDDATQAIVSGKADRRIRYLAQPHAGACAARNLGLLHARGEIIAYLDSDNTWYTGYLASVVEAFDATPEALSSYAAVLILDEAVNEAHILALPFDRAALEVGNRIDLNAFAHRRELYERLGDFDESLTRLQDWDLILRYTEAAPPVELPILGVRYQAGRSDSISARESHEHNRATILRKRQPRVEPPLKVLYALWHYPQLSESYVETEIRYMQHRGVDVEVWSEVVDPTSPYPTSVPMHHGSLAAAIERTRPHVVHVHWLSQAAKHADTIAAAGLSSTVRGHGFEVTPDAITALEQHEAVRAIYLFPHFAGENLHQRPKIRPMTACFDPGRYWPDAEKDPRLVVRTACALSTKDLHTFLHLAQQFPEHHFVLALVRVQGLEGYADELVAYNQSLGSPVDIRINVSYPQIAALVRKAGIYLHTHGLVAPYGMPISIAEAMATGCYVIARRCPASVAYVGPAGQLYDTPDEAAALVQATLDWNAAQWQHVRRTAVDHGFRHYVDSAVLGPLVDEWQRIAQKTVVAESVTRRAA